MQSILPTMSLKTIQAAEAKKRFGSILRDVEHGDVVLIKRWDHLVAAVVPVDEDGNPWIPEPIEIVLSLTR